MVRAAATKVEIQADSDVAAKVLHARGMPEFHIFSCRPDFSSGQKHIDPAKFVDAYLQAKALDSVLKEVNQRFGKGSIMKLGGIAQKV